MSQLSFFHHLFTRGLLWMDPIAMCYCATHIIHDSERERRKILLNWLKQCDLFMVRFGLLPYRKNGIFKSGLWWWLGITMAKQLCSIIIIKAKVCSSQEFIINGKGEHCLTEDAVLLDESGNGPPSVERSLTWAWNPRRSSYLFFAIRVNQRE